MYTIGGTSQKGNCIQFIGTEGVDNYRRTCKGFTSLQDYMVTVDAVSVYNVRVNIDELYEKLSTVFARARGVHS